MKDYPVICRGKTLRFLFPVIWWRQERQGHSWPCLSFFTLPVFWETLPQSRQSRSRWSLNNTMPTSRIWPIRMARYSWRSMKRGIPIYTRQDTSSSNSCNKWIILLEAAGVEPVLQCFYQSVDIPGFSCVIVHLGTYWVPFNTWKPSNIFIQCRSNLYQVAVLIFRTFLHFLI